MISERLELPFYLHCCLWYTLVFAINSVIMTSLNRFLSCSCLASSERKLQLVRQGEMRVCQRWWQPELLNLILPIVLHRNSSLTILPIVLHRNVSLNTLLLLFALVLPLTHVWALFNIAIEAVFTWYFVLATKSFASTYSNYVQVGEPSGESGLPCDTRVPRTWESNRLLPALKTLLY